MKVAILRSPGRGILLAPQEGQDQERLIHPGREAVLAWAHKGKATILQVHVVARGWDSRVKATIPPAPVVVPAWGERVAGLLVRAGGLGWVQEVAAQWAVLAAARCEGALRVEVHQVRAAAQVLVVQVAAVRVAAAPDGNLFGFSKRRPLTRPPFFITCTSVGE